LSWDISRLPRHCVSGTEGPLGCLGDKESCTFLSSIVRSTTLLFLAHMHPIPLAKLGKQCLDPKKMLQAIVVRPANQVEIVDERPRQIICNSSSLMELFLPFGLESASRLAVGPASSNIELMVCRNGPARSCLAWSCTCRSGILKT
jgi:hypothetical protein